MKSNNCEECCKYPLPKRLNQPYLAWDILIHAHDTFYLQLIVGINPGGNRESLDADLLAIS